MDGKQLWRQNVWLPLVNVARRLYILPLLVLSREEPMKKVGILIAVSAIALVPATFLAGVTPQSEIVWEYINRWRSPRLQTESSG